MKKTIVLIFVGLILLLLISCASDEEITAELVEYYNEVWVPTQTMKHREIGFTQENLLEIMESLGESNDKDKIVVLLKEDALPVADKVLERFKTVQLEHKKVNKMNELQIKAEESGKILLNKLIDYNKGDLTEEEYMEAQNELKRKYDDVLDYRNQLMEEYGLEFDQEEYRAEGFYELQRAED